jgi:hypothetical protein
MRNDSPSWELRVPPLVLKLYESSNEYHTRTEKTPEANAMKDKALRRQDRLYVAGPQSSVT